jgi:hypothetical protein
MEKHELATREPDWAPGKPPSVIAEEEQQP